MKIQWKALAFSCAVMAVTYAPAQAEEAVSNLAVSEHDEANLPQDIFEELRSTPELPAVEGTIDASQENLMARGRHGRGGHHGGGNHGGRHGGHGGHGWNNHHGHGGHGWDNGWRRHRYPRYIPVPSPLRQVCFARDAGGRLFRASGFGSSYAIQRAAVRTCEYNSRLPHTCRPRGCRY